MGGVERFAGEPIAAIVDRFMAMEPKPGNISVEDWLTERQRVRGKILDAMTQPGSDPRDYKVEPGLWRSQILPIGVTIDQAISDGVW
jgi:hypothetical protein